MVDEALDEQENEFGEPEEFEAEEILELEGEDEESEQRERLSLTAQISSLLFVSPKPITLDDLAQATGKDSAVVQDAMEQVLDMYADSVHGFSVVEVAGGYQLRTAPAAAGVIRRFKPPKTRKLSRAAAETLAVIAYKQPVQRAEIESIRGVDALPTLKTLLDAKIVRVVGHENSVGRPALYGTTSRFLEVFGLRDLSELPSIRELEQLAEEPGETADWQVDLTEADFEEQNEEPSEVQILSEADDSSPAQQAQSQNAV
jgi:segregation and condensation protein B